MNVKMNFYNIRVNVFFKFKVLLPYLSIQYPL